MFISPLEIRNVMKGCDILAKSHKDMRVTSKKSISYHAHSLEEQENHLISLAVDLAEQQLRDGTASSQVITHYLKLGTMKERLEREKLEEENKLLRAKTEALQSGKEIEELYSKALQAMTAYRGNDNE